MGYRGKRDRKWDGNKDEQECRRAVERGSERDENRNKKTHSAMRY